MRAEPVCDVGFGQVARVVTICAQPNVAESVDGSSWPDQSAVGCVSAFFCGGSSR